MKKQLPISLYWKCQVAGWSLASLYWAYIGFTGTNFSRMLALIHFTGDLVIYISLSHAYRNFSLHYKWQTLAIRQLIARIIPAIIVLGAGFMFLTIFKNHLVRQWFEPGFKESLRYSFETSWVPTFITGTRLMSIWVLAYYGYHFTQREFNAVKESARLAMIAKDAQFNNLSAQLNPHFFFNSLNSIKALVSENPPAARRAIDLLSDLLRNALYGRNTDLISVKEEMELIHDYLELEKIRFEKRLQTTMDIDEELQEAMILPLSIQLLVENAIKHGLAKTKEGCTIGISIQQQQGHIYTVVQNPGVLVMTEKTGLGLKNLKERLQLQFKGKASFNIVQNKETVTATMITPLVCAK